ncbi:uncharacterized protein LOC117604914 isoform X1 [Osmia lignaria lignaria]|uniref:uncharacterized protein LOC117604914 isoform X1 n=1 Tax=Osmia lignaria lignaria TaxID=1437193 RepID=UPI00402B178E
MKYIKMLTLETYQLTHPESLTDAELREILENRCIDFNHYKNFTRCELIELYKRVAMPLPQRQSENSQNSNVKKDNEESNSVNESHQNSVPLNDTSSTKPNVNEVTKAPQFSNMKSATSPGNEFKCTTKKVHLCNSSNIIKCNGVDKRNSDEKFDVGILTSCIQDGPFSMNTFGTFI